MGDEGGVPLEFRILGPLEVSRGGECLPFRGSRERALVALLVLNANRTVSAERLADDLWSGNPAEGAIRSLRVYVSRLRQALGAAGHAVVTRPSGYLLQVDPEAVDALRFEALVARGREQAEAGDHGPAAATLREALALWRGPALADLCDAPFARVQATQLEEARLAALEDRIEADLASGRHGELTAELEALTREHPFRERLWSQRIVALYRAGRQADALRAYQGLRQCLAEDLGLEPSEALRRLESAVLRHDPELDWRPADRPGGAGASLPPGGLPGVVTFLFTDVVGSTELLGEVGEEAAEKLRQSHFALLRVAIDAHGGVEVKSLGDGLMVVFTSPLKALSAAVAMQEAVAAEGPAQPRPVHVRIGLHAGEPMRDEDDYYGTPVVVAKRLCDQAVGGQILASGLVRDLVGPRGDHGFAFRHLGGLSLKGLPDPVAACEVLWSSAPAGVSGVMPGQPGQLPLSLGREEPVRLVGRAAEVARLEAAWRASTAGDRRLVLLGGEPGIGKSRLMREFARRAHGDGAVVLFGRCEEGMGVPYQPFVEALTRYLRDSPAPVLGRLAGELVRLVPEVAERAPGLPLPLRADPETERYRLFEAVASWLAAISGSAPVLFVIDDLHWATKPTLLLLSHVAGSEESLPLLLVAAYRDTPLDVTGDLADAVGELFRQPGVERVSLSGLDADGVAAFMAAQARHELDEDGRALARVLHAETAGNPFFVREMLRHLAEKGAVVQEEGRWVTGKPLSEVDVPDSVREVVGRRLTRLPDKTDEVLAVAAVLGERFELPVLVAAVGEPPNEVLRALDPAMAARLVEETAIGHYHFAHALVRSTLEDALGHTRRAQLHLRAAEAIESVFAGQLGGRAAILAAHYQQAGSLAEPGRTIDALIRAGQEAAKALAWEEVADYWQAALELMERTQPADARRADLLARLADLLFVAGFDLERSIRCAEQAVALFETLGDRRRVAVIRSRLGGYLATNAWQGIMDVPRSLRELHEAAKVLDQEPDTMAHGYMQGSLGASAGIWAAQLDEGLAASRRGMQIGEALGNDAVWVLGAIGAGFSLIGLGCLAEGFAMVERAWETADRIDHRYLATRALHTHTAWDILLRDPCVTARWAERELAKRRLARAPIQRKLVQSQLAWAHVLRGRLAEGRQILADIMDFPIGVYRPSLETWEGDWEAAETVLMRALDGHRATGNRFDEPRLDLWLAEVCRLRGDHDRAAAFFADALDIVVAAGHRIFEIEARVGLTLLAVDQGRLSEAQEQAGRARGLLAPDEHWRGLAGRVHLAEAVVRAAEGNLSVAEACFARAIEVFRRFSLAWDEAEALVLWGRSLGWAGEPTRALERFDAALSTYDRCGAGPPWRDRIQRERSSIP